MQAKHSKHRYQSHRAIIGTWQSGRLHLTVTQVFNKRASSNLAVPIFLHITTDGAR